MFLSKIVERPILINFFPKTFSVTQNLTDLELRSTWRTSWTKKNAKFRAKILLVSFLAQKLLKFFLRKFLCFSRHCIKVTKITHQSFFYIIILSLECLQKIFFYALKTTITHKRKEVASSLIHQITHISNLLKCFIDNFDNTVDPP